MNKPQLRSTVALARLLDCEGFTPRLANCIRKFAMRKWPKSQVAKFLRTKAELSKICERLTEGEKAVLGRYISMHKAMAFQTGLKMGVGARVLGEPQDGLNEEETVGLPSIEKHDRLYLAQRHDHPEADWKNLTTPLESREMAKQIARDEARRFHVPTRVLQAGHVVQRYDERGHKRGGD